MICAYCHEHLGREGALACARCRTMLHAECAVQHGQCVTLGCTGGELVEPLRVLGPRRLEPELPLVVHARSWLRTGLEVALAPCEDVALVVLGLLGVLGVLLLA